MKCLLPPCCRKGKRTETALQSPMPETQRRAGARCWVPHLPGSGPVTDLVEALPGEYHRAGLVVDRTNDRQLVVIRLGNGPLVHGDWLARSVAVGDRSRSENTRFHLAGVVIGEIGVTA